MGSGFAKMKKQARMLEMQVEKMREEMQAKKYTATSAAGLIQVTINGEKELTNIQISPTCIDPNDPQGLEDLIKSTLEAAYLQLAQDSSQANTPHSFSF